MSIRQRREARHERRDAAREVKLATLRQGTNLRASPWWATVVQSLAFVRKELAEIVRQPKLLVLLVLGPFVLLLLFGAGYEDTTIRLRTEFVAPQGSVYEQAVDDHADQLDDYVDVRGFTNDEAAAVRRLKDGQLDVVVVFPTDPLQDIVGGKSAEIQILHDTIDPLQQTAVEIASRLAVQEVNAGVLSAIAGGAQSALMPIDDVVGTLSEQAAVVSGAVSAGDATALADAAATAGDTLAGARLLLSTSANVIDGLGGEGRSDQMADLIARLDTAAEDAAAIRDGSGDPTDRASRLASTLQEVAADLPSATTVDPAVLVRPFEAHPENVGRVELQPADYFVPSSIMLLLQHLALTFAALSLVRDREVGLLELLRVGPLSSLEILVGKTIAYLVVGVAVGAVLIGAAVLVLGVPLQGSLLWVAAAVVLVLLASLALGMVLSMISGSETQAVQYAMLTLLAGMFFSGFILDVSQLATPYRYLSYLLPVTYGIDVLRDTMLRGSDPAWSEMGGLGLLVVVYGSLAVLMLRRRLRTA